MKSPALLPALFSVVLGIAIGLMLNPILHVEEQGRITPWLEVAHRVCTSIGGLGTFVALIVVLRQFHLLRAQSTLVQKNIVASMDAQLYARLDSFNRFIFEHSREYDLLDQPFPSLESAEARSKLHRMCELGFTFYEEILKHKARLELLDGEDWTEWEQNMAHLFRKPYVRGYWKTVADRYSNSFQTVANQLVAKLEAA
jgi:hypothetical protein